MFDQEPDAEECACCTELTGRAGMDEDSLHVGELGPFCERCHEYIEREVATLRTQVAELEKRVSLKGQEVVDVLNNAERYYADFRARIAELEAWKADSLLRWQQAVTLGGQQLERIAELEREKGELAATVEARTCRHGWRGLSCEAHQQIANRCPACKGQLFIASKGWLTCANLKCREPDAAGDAIDAAMKPTT